MSAELFWLTFCSGALVGALAVIVAAVMQVSGRESEREGYK